MLSRVVDTRVLPKSHRDARWKRATAEFLVPLEITAGELPVTGRIAGVQRGGVNLCHLMASAHFGTRTAGLAGGSGSDYYKVAIATHGTVTVRQHGRTAHLGPGRWTVYDTGDEYEVGAAHPFGLFIALVPRKMLAERAQVAAMSAVVLDSPEAATVLIEAARSGASLEPGIEAVANVLCNPKHTFVSHSASDEVIYREATAFIRSRLADEALGPAYLSAVLGVSRRRLYDIFGQRAGPIARVIRNQRLACARGMLSDPGNTAMPVNEIAASVGFSDPAHFSRLFRAAFGCTPSQIRTQLCG